MKNMSFFAPLTGLLILVFLAPQMGCKKENDKEGSAPVVDFTGIPTSGKAPLTVIFNDQSTNSPTSWRWNFGDGGTDTTQNPSYTYNSAGTYAVKLTATNSLGSDIEEKTGYIVVSASGSPPVASFSGVPASGTAPLTVNFSDQSTNSPTNWAWNFGDGGTSTQQNPWHTFDSAGTYTVELVVSNGFGTDTVAINNYITVTAVGVDGEPCPGVPTITYEGQTYNTVLIGSQCWMKENLNYATGNSWCYDNNSSNCDAYGRLYDWETIMNGESSSNKVPSGVQGICPPGWHVPSDAEWEIIADHLGGSVVAGGKMKEAGYAHWDSPNTGATNESGFTALPGGVRDANGSFNILGNLGYWWSSTEYNSSNAWGRYLLADDDDVGRLNFDETLGFSLRCLKD